MAISASEAYDEEVSIVFVAEDLKVWHRYLVYLLLSEVSHEVVVLRVSRDGASLVVLLQSAENVLEALSSRHGPVAHACLLVSHIWCPRALEFLWHVWRVDGWVLCEVGELEGSRTVRHVCVGHEDDRSHVFECHL